MAKTDNSHEESKLELRRYALRNWHPTPPRVLDCFAGESNIWNKLRQEFEVSSYCPLDVKRRKGRLQIDSLRFLQAGPPEADIIDLDAYGLPWDHWNALLVNPPLPCTVFLTMGVIMTLGGCAYPHNIAAMLPASPNMPRSLMAKLLHHTHRFELAKAVQLGILETVVEALPYRKARYMAVRLTQGNDKRNNDHDKRHDAPNVR